MNSNSWWPLALSEAITSQKPTAISCGTEDIVLFRNMNGEAQALEDRCPHRRVPLSLGVVKPTGLQCAYHGWTFDGATGACNAIPNLHADEPVPPRYAARCFRIREGNGFVHVWLGESAPDANLPTADYRPAGRETTGSAIVNMVHDEYLSVMLDGPDCLMSFDGVKMTDFFLGDPRFENGWLVLDRGAVWKKQIQPPQFVVDYPLIVRTSVPVAGGTVRIELLTAEERQLVTVVLGSAAHRRGTTSICWRGFLHKEHIGVTPLRWRAARAAGRAPFTVSSEISGAVVASLLVAPSRDLAAARKRRINQIPVAVIMPQPAAR